MEIGNRLFYVVNTVAINSYLPRQNGRHFPDDMLNAFSWMEKFLFRSVFH